MATLGGIQFIYKPAEIEAVVGVAVVTAGMSAQNNCTAFRFTARSDKDIKGAVLSFSAATAPGTCQIRLETIDPATGKPTGTLYDAAASKSFTPAVGTNVVTFDVTPTAGLTIGTEYALVVICTVDAGTSHTLRRSQAATASGARDIIPAVTLYASDGSTRSNLAEAFGKGIFALIDEDNNYQLDIGNTTFYTNTTFALHGADRAAGLKVVLDQPATVESVIGTVAFIKTGTPAGDLRVRVLDSGKNAVAGMTWTLDKDSLNTSVSSASGLSPLFPTSGTGVLAAGTYYIAFDSIGSANGSNCWTVYAGQSMNSSSVNSSWLFWTTTDMSTSFTITVDDDAVPGVGFHFSSYGSSGGGPVGPAGLDGGIRQ